jgi:hypothetical protein
MPKQTTAQTSTTTKKRRGRKKGSKNRKSTSAPTAKQAYTGKRRGRKPGKKYGNRTGASSTPTGINFIITGGVLIMNSIPKGVTSMVFVKGSQLTTVEI